MSTDHDTGSAAEQERLRQEAAAHAARLAERRTPEPVAKEESR